MFAERFSGKVAIVTGAAGGIGRAIAERLAAEGAAVLLADIQEEAGAAVAQTIVQNEGKAAFRRADVSQTPECAALVEEALQRWGRLDVLINSAGIGRGGPVAACPDEDWEHVMDVNLTGTFRCCRAAFPALAASGSGAIVNLASLAAFRAKAGMAAYAASKAGVVQFTRVLAIEGAASGLRANVLCPVWIDTPMLRGYAARHPEPELALRGMAAEIPLGRLGTPADVAAAALFLASDEASFITGVALPIDGGALSA